MKNIDSSWHAVADACKMYGLAYGAGFVSLGLLRAVPGFAEAAQTSPWIPRYVGDVLAFAVTMVMLRRASKGRLKDYGFILAGRDLKLRVSTFLGIMLGVIWMLLDSWLSAQAGGVDTQATYPRTPMNLAGMLSFQWVFVGILEEPLARGLVQTHLMKHLKGTVGVLKWNLHTGTVVAGLLFGVGHVVPHLFFGRPWLFLGPELALATLFGVLAGYIYQETRSLAGPVLMHNIVDGLLHTAALA